MLNKKLFCMILMPLLFILNSASVLAQADLKIGVVNLAKIYDSSPQKAAAVKKFQDEFVARKDKLNKLQAELTALGDKFNRDALAMSADERESAQMKFLDKKRKFQWEMGVFDEDKKIREQAMTGGINQIIIKAIQEIGQNGKFDLIMADGIVFKSGRMDVSGEVLELLKKQAGSK